MIWNSHSLRLEEPNIDEREWVMGFHIGVSSISKGAHKRILEQVIDLNYHMDI
jgi:hypothetical protein